MLRISFQQIAPLYLVTPRTKTTVKYGQIVTSIREISLVEPIVVARNRHDPTMYTLLDGHLRLEALKDDGETTTSCIASTDDEALTYNKRISRLATIQEHKMILRALMLGVPEERLASALNVNIKTMKEKRRLLDGICGEAADLLKDKQAALTGFRIPKTMKPLRPIVVGCDARKSAYRRRDTKENQRYIPRTTRAHGSLPQHDL